MPGRSAEPGRGTRFVNSTTLDRVVALVWRDSGRVALRTRAQNRALYPYTRADAESARAAASSTPHVAAPARTVGRWGPHGPRWAAESAEMARFGVTGGGILEILASGAVSYLEIERRPSSTSNCAISAKLSMDRAHLVMIDL